MHVIILATTWGMQSRSCRRLQSGQSSGHPRRLKQNEIHIHIRRHIDVSMRNDKLRQDVRANSQRRNKECIKIKIKTAQEGQVILKRCSNLCFVPIFFLRGAYTKLRQQF